MKKESTNNSDQIARIMAERVVAYCEKGHRNFPKDKFIYSSEQAQVVYNYLFDYVQKAWNLDAITEESRAGHVENMFYGFKNVALYTDSGADILEEKRGAVDGGSYSWGSCLFALREYGYVDDATAKGFPNIYLQICLYLLYQFHEACLKAFLCAEEFDKEEKAVNSYKAIIDAYGILIEAQQAYAEAGFLNEVIRKNIAEIKFEELESSKTKGQAIITHNARQQDEAKKKWLPIVKDVDAEIEKRGKGVSDACRIVAKRHEIEGVKPEKMVSAKYYKYKKYL